MYIYNGITVTEPCLQGSNNLFSPHVVGFRFYVRLASPRLTSTRLGLPRLALIRIALAKNCCVVEGRGRERFAGAVYAACAVLATFMGRCCSSCYALIMPLSKGGLSRPLGPLVRHISPGQKLCCFAFVLSAHIYIKQTYIRIHICSYVQLWSGQHIRMIC